MTLAALTLERVALLVIDPQNAFCHDKGTLGISGVNVAPAQAAVGRIRELVEAFRAAERPVIWTQQVHLDSDAARARKALPSHTDKRERISALSGTWDADFVDEIKDLVNDPTMVIVKHRFGAFHETRLDSLLDMLGIDALVITGVTANACVETTIREAYVRDYDVVAVEDAIAAVRPHWAETTREVWSHYFGVVSSSSEVQSWLRDAQEPRAIGVHHLLLETQDLDASVQFFTEVLGFRVRKREDFRDGRRLVVTEQGLGLTEGGSGSKGVLEHLCFRARGIDALAERAAAAGHTIVRGPGPGPYGHTVYVLDPDGNEIELFDITKS